MTVKKETKKEIILSKDFENKIQDMMFESISESKTGNDFIDSIHENLNVDKEIDNFQNALNGRSTNADKIKYIQYYTCEGKKAPLFREFLVEKFYVESMPLFGVLTEKIEEDARVKTHNEIKESGGNLEYYLKRCKGYYQYETIEFPKTIKLLDYIAEQYKEISANIIDTPIIEVKTDTPEIGENKTNKNDKVYTLELDEKMKLDLKKLSIKKYVELDSKDKPNFKSKLSLVVLFDYWRETILNNEDLHKQNIKYPFINDNFLVKGKKPNVNTNYYNGNEYRINKDEILSDIKKILK